MTISKINEPNTKQNKSTDEIKKLLNQGLLVDGNFNLGERHDASLWDKFFCLPIWDLAFRPWFLLASLSSIFSLGAWLLYLNGFDTSLGQKGLSATIWHIHEMVFGFAATIAVAFLLTAVQTWTGCRSVHGHLLVALTILWLMVRGLLWSGNALFQWVAIYLQGLWWVACIISLAYLVIKTRNRRNYLFVPLLSFLMLLNTSILYLDLTNNTALALHFSRTAILLFSLLIGIVAGRVVPFFTKKGVNNAKVTDTPILDKCLIVSSILGIGMFLSSAFFELSELPGVLMVLLGGLHLFRLLHWDSLSVKTVSLLWSLHISYFFLSVGFFAMGASYFFNGISLSDALHLISVGTVGGMILAMMARVSLGHTGRPLKVLSIVNIAFLCLFLSALMRFLLPIFSYHFLAWNLSGSLWFLAFSTFCVFYAAILFKKRQV